MQKVPNGAGWPDKFSKRSFYEKRKDHDELFQEREKLLNNFGQTFELEL